MSTYPAPQDHLLTFTPCFEEEVAALEKCFLDGSFFKAVRQEGQEENIARRADSLSVLLRDLDTEESAQFLMAAAKMSLSGEVTGLRTLFAAFNVRRSGVEILKRLQSMASIERTSLLLLSGKWSDTAQSESENPAFSILEVLREAAAQGMLVDALGSWPKSPEAVRQTLDILRHWMAWMILKLAADQEIPKKSMDLITQICLLEISLAERRVSQLAEKVDPYDTRCLARLMPIVSRYDQDIEVWKQVVSEIHTYVPFSKVVLTLETVITETEMERIQNELLRHPGGQILGLLFQHLRQNPILDREFLCLISVMYQTANLIALNHPGEYDPVDLLSASLRAIDEYQGGSLPPLVLEPQVMESSWPVLESWGVWKNTAEGLVYAYNENRSLNFINPDGTPVLDPIPGFHNHKELSIESLVLAQLGNDAFILGVLDNPKALLRPTVVPNIAMLSRSSRVLSKIATSRHLYTGANNKDIPRLLLSNPTRVPVQTLRHFIHVRYVSKTDLAKMGKPNSDIRPDVRSEIQRYLISLRS